MMEQRRCRVCGGEATTVMEGLFDNRFGAPGRFDIIKCRSCGLEQTWPQPGEPELKELYQRYYNLGAEPEGTYAGLRERLFRSPLYRLWLRWDGDISFYLRQGAGRLLDVGCNEGRGLDFYRGSGFQAEGLEINERAAALARQRGFQVHTVPLEQFHPEEPYAVTVLSNVLEHAVSPPAMLAEVRRLLKPAGEVWISCPNAASRWRRIFGRAWVNWHVPFHLWHFSPKTLGETLEGAGFRVVSLETFTPSLWIAQSICVGLGSREGRVNRAMRSAPLVAALMLAARAALLPLDKRRNRQLAGDCLIVRARKDANER